MTALGLANSGRIMRMHDVQSILCDSACAHARKTNIHDLHYLRTCILEVAVNEVTCTIILIEYIGIGAPGCSIYNSTESHCDNQHSLETIDSRPGVALGRPRALIHIHDSRRDTCMHAQGARGDGKHAWVGCRGAACVIACMVPTSG